MEGDPRPRAIWTVKGSHPLTNRTAKHVRLNVVTAVAPASGACTALIFHGCDSEVFNVFLYALAVDQPPVPDIAHHFILDSAS